MMSSPAPPLSTGVERKYGSHVNTPQYANSTEVASAVAHSVIRRKGGRSRIINDTGSRLRVSQIRGSSTLRLIHIVNSAGARPTRQRRRQCGSNNQLTTAASL